MQINFANIPRTCSLPRDIPIVPKNWHIHLQHVFNSSLLTHDGTMEVAFYSWCFLHKNRSGKKKKIDSGPRWWHRGFLKFPPPLTDTSYTTTTQRVVSFEENPKPSWVTLTHPPAQKTVALKCAWKSETQNHDRPQHSTLNSQLLPEEWRSWYIQHPNFSGCHLRGVFPKGRAT